MLLDIPTLPGYCVDCDGMPYSTRRGAPRPLTVHARSSAPRCLLVRALVTDPATGRRKPSTRSLARCVWEAVHGQPVPQTRQVGYTGPWPTVETVYLLGDTPPDYF